MTPEELKSAAEAQLSTAEAFLLITINEAGIMAHACVLGGGVEQMAMAAQANAYHQAITGAETASIISAIYEPELPFP